MKVISSWSSGKDSCLACYKTIRAGHDVKYLFTTISGESKRINFHGTNTKLLDAQSQAAGIPMLRVETTPDGYTQEFKDGVRKLIEKDGIEGMVFGDIYLEWHKEWIDEVCADLGIEPIMPLWNKDTSKLINEFIDSGFEAVIVGVSGKHVADGDKLVGRTINREFVEYVRENVDKFSRFRLKGGNPQNPVDYNEIKSHGTYENCDFDICGENGEYHTFVTGGPLFKKKIKILKSEKVYREKEYKGKVYGNWFLDILEYRLERNLK